MTLPVFVVDTRALQAHLIELSGAEGRHAAAVRRIRPGERILICDTLGAGAECAVRIVSKASLTAEVLARREEPAPRPRLVVVQAIPKGDHAERAVDLLTEVGVDEIVPWVSSRTVVSWRGERGDKALARWRATAYAAGKQSRRLRFCAVAPPCTTDQVSCRLRQASLGVVLHETADTPIRAVDLPVDGEVVLVVGPEGGLTDDELAGFAASGARLVRLGPTVLRTSTAGAVAAAVLASRTSRWR
jgi:16S rRNA (uracil1498-N3)-methyltransferase